MRKTLSALAIALLLFAVGMAPTGGGTAAAPDSRRDPEIAAPVADDAPQYVELVSSSSEEVVLDVHVDEFNARDVEVGDTVYQRLSLPGAGRTLEVGRPELPVIGQFVAVPQGADVEIEVQDLEQSTQMGYRVFPAQPPLVDCARPQDGDPALEIDHEAYGQNRFFPQQYVVASAPQTLRNLDVVWLSIHPLQFNPSRGELRFNRTMRIRLTFTGGAEVFPAEGRPGVDSAFRPMCEAFVINCDSVAPPLSAEGYPPDGNGVEFLIITAPEYAEAADALALWKNERGISTRVVTTSETGTTASAIKSYIENAFHSWTPQPAYVLLLGDADQIPVHYVNIHPAYDITTWTGTDLYYGTMGGSDDVLPDIHLGRIPVASLSQANHVVNKIIAYETNPPADPSFYTNAVAAAEFQDDDRNGYEDRLFVWTSEQIRDHLVSEGYTVERIYYTHGDIDPHHYNDGRPPNGEPLPSELRKPGFAWDGDNQDILNALNAGAFVISHRDHGWVGGWAAPSFNLSDIDSLTNGAETPVVFSINCETGRFDSETDANEWTTDDPGFAEKFLRHGWDTSPGQGGAVGVFAATRISYSWYNDYLVQGFYDSIWPSFLPYSALSPSPRMGNTLTHGKYYYASEFGTNAFVTLELFHYLGDPTMEIWTGVPSDLSVSHPATADLADGSFTVNVAQDGALVAISQEGQLLGTATAVGGSATVPLDIPFEGGPANVTVTKHNYRPYRGTINVRPVVDFPFYDGFESGELAERWMLFDADSEARVRVGDADAYDGAHSLLLDDREPNDVYSTSAAELTIDLSGESDVLLDFWWREFTDEDHEQDGVFISDDGGDSWHRVLSFNGGPQSFRHDIVDIDEAAASHGLTLNERFMIRFQSYDNYPIMSDGYAIDDVCVRPEVIAPPWRESMERGLYGWTATDLWHRIEENTSSHPETHSPTHSWWYGLEATGNYSTGAAISGTLTSPPISIPASAPEPALQFWSWYETETYSTTYDIRRVEISRDGETFPAGEQLWGEPMRSWQHHEIDLSDYVGNTIWVRFHFDTVDSYYNDYRGWYIDDVVVQLADPVYLPLILRNSN